MEVVLCGGLNFIQDLFEISKIFSSNSCKHSFIKVSRRFQHKKHNSHSTDVISISSTRATSQHVVLSILISIQVQIAWRSTRVWDTLYLCWKLREGNVLNLNHMTKPLWLGYPSGSKLCRGWLVCGTPLPMLEVERREYCTECTLYGGRVVCGQPWYLVYKLTYYWY